MTATPAQQAIVDRLVDAAVAYFPGLTREDIYARRRTAPVAACRAAVAYTLYRAGWALKDIGNALGGRDHSTVHHLVRRYERGYYDDDIPAATLTLSPPRDINTVVDRVLALESEVAALRSQLAELNSGVVRRVWRTA